MAKRYQQPQSGPVQLNPKWLDKGLHLVFSGNRIIYDGNSRPQTATLVGGPKLVVTPTGIATGFGATYGAGTTDRIDGPVLPAPASGFRSIIAHFNARTSGGGGFGRIFQPTAGSGFDAGEALYFTGSSLAYTKYATTAIGQWGATAAIGLDVQTSVGVSHNQSAVGFSPSLFVAGKPAALTIYSTSAGNYGAGVATSFGNRASDGTRGWNGTLGIILFFDGLLSATDHADLHANPWQVFADTQRNIWVSAAGGGSTYTLTADSTALTLDGQDAGLIANRRLAADTSALTLTGQDAGLITGRRLAADSASLTLAAQDAAMVAGRRLVADTSALTLSGQDATLTYTPVSGATYTLSAESSSLVLAGQDAALIAVRRLAADSAAFDLVAQDASLLRGYVLAAASGDFSLVGQDAALIASRRLAAESCALTLTWQAAALTYSGEVAPPVSGAMAGNRRTSMTERPAQQETRRSNRAQSGSRSAR